MTKKKINQFIAVSISCFLAMFIFFINTSVTAFAVENNEKPFSYNSVVEVESYEVEGGYIQAGKENIIKLKIKNANKISAANSLVAVVSSTSGMVFPAYGIDNQFFIGTLEGGASTTIEVPVVTTSQLTGEYVDLTCSLIYEIGGNKITNASNMALPTQNISAVAVSAVDVSTHASLNGKSLLSITYSNNSAENINDAVLSVEGNVSETTRIIDLGSIVAGKSYTKDCYVIFTETGEQTITINLKYTNGNGDYLETELGSFKVNVEEMNSSDSSETTGNPMLAMIGRIITLVALAVAVIIALVYYKKR